LTSEDLQDAPDRSLNPHYLGATVNGANAALAVPCAIVSGTPKLRLSVAPDLSDFCRCCLVV